MGQLVLIKEWVNLATEFIDLRVHSDEMVLVIFAKDAANVQLSHHIIWLTDLSASRRVGLQLRRSDCIVLLLCLIPLGHHLSH